MELAPELIQLLQAYYAASARGDTQFLSQLIARDPGALVIGTDPSEWWSGGDAIVQTWSAAWQTRGGLTVSDSQPQAHRAGSIGWVADRAKFVLPNGKTMPFRLTAVFEFADGKWQMVQAHFSFGVPD